MAGATVHLCARLPHKYANVSYSLFVIFTPWKIWQIWYKGEVWLLNVSKVLWPPQWVDVTVCVCVCVCVYVCVCMCVCVYIYIYIYIYKQSYMHTWMTIFIIATVIRVRRLAMCYGSMPKLYLQSHKKHWGWRIQIFLSIISKQTMQRRWFNIQINLN